MYNEMDGVKDAGDSYQLNADIDSSYTDSADVTEVRAVSNNDDASATPNIDVGRCDLASKPTSVPLSSRASAFSIAALMKDRRETDTSVALLGDEQRQGDGEGHRTSSGSMYDTAADQWQQRDGDYSASGEVVNTKTEADYWLTFNNNRQRRT